MILWDIDGTLIRTGGVGARAIEAGAAEVGALVDVPAVRMSGKTDPQILREIFTAAELSPARITDLLPHAVAAVERALAAAEADLRRHGAVLPGVVATMELLAQCAGVRQSLVTGNLATNAAVKLAAFDLTKHLDVEVGAYGSDHAERDMLVPIALERVERLRGERFEPSEVWVIGDTPRDLACARAAGVRCLLVATGATGVAELQGLGADAVLADLGEPEAVLNVLRF